MFVEFDEKELLWLEKYKYIIESYSFDECDLLGFLIFIRNFVNKHEKELNYIKEFCDLVAHRSRNRGIAMSAIKSAEKNKYCLNEDGTVKGYHGIDSKKWIDQWKLLFNWLEFKVTDRMIQEITLCVFSIAQGMECRNGTFKGEIHLFQNQNGNLYLTTCEGEKDSQFINFACSGKYDFKFFYVFGYIDETVITYRENNELHLKSKNHLII